MMITPRITMAVREPGQVRPQGVDGHGRAPVQLGGVQRAVLAGRERDQVKLGHLPQPAGLFYQPLALGQTLRTLACCRSPCIAGAFGHPASLAATAGGNGRKGMAERV